jgi:hypothetical protein
MGECRAARAKRELNGHGKRELNGYGKRELNRREALEV